MITLQLYFHGVQELQDFLEKFPDSKKYIELEAGRPLKGVRSQKGWTEFEDEHICSEYSWKSARVIAEALHRTPSAVGQRIFQLRKAGRLKAKYNRNGKASITKT